MIPSLLAQPEVLIEAAGSPLDARIATSLHEILIFQGLSVPALAEVTFHGSGVDPDEFSTAFPHGSSLRLSMGMGSPEIFVGEITATEFEFGPGLLPVCRVRAADALQKLRQRQKVRAFVDVDLAGLAVELVGGLGLAISAVAGPVWPRLIQYGQTDFGILQSAAEQSGFFFTLDQGELRFLTLEGYGEPVVLRPGETLREICMESNTDRAWHTVAASGWNPHDLQSHEATSSSPRSVANAAALPATDTERYIVARTLVGEPHAQAQAQGELDRRRAASLWLRAVAEGNPELRPGRRIRVEGVGRALSGDFVISEARHRFDPDCRFSTEISTRPQEPRHEPPAPRTLTVPGIVVRVDDPRDSGRVRVSLPTIGDVETDWMPVVLPAVGKGKGFVALPDVGDRVLILCPGGDPSLGVVLGGLPDFDYGAAGLTKGGITPYLFTTSAGQSLCFDAGAKSLKLENKDAGSLEITGSGVHLRSGADLVIEAPGHTITIRAKAVQFEEG